MFEGGNERIPSVAVTILIVQASREARPVAAACLNWWAVVGTVCGLDKEYNK